MRPNQKTTFARTLRKNLTDAERHLWFRLRGNRLGGFRFRRQHPVGPYIADFACLQPRLLVELDGGQHLDSAYDNRRDAFLHSQGYVVLRFWNNDVLGQTDGVLTVILEALLAGGPHPNPPPQAGEGYCTPTPALPRKRGRGRL